MQSYPLVPLRETVLFPHVLTPLLVGRERSMRALEDALDHDQMIVVVAQRSADHNDPAPDDLYETGTLIEIGRLLHMPDGATSILAQGVQRVKIDSYEQTDPFFRVRVMPIVEPRRSTLATEALMRAVRTLFERYAQLSGQMPEEIYSSVIGSTEPGMQADLIASTLRLTLPELQDLLEAVAPADRLQRVHAILEKEISVTELEHQIQDRVHQEMDKSQKEYFLREQIRVIQNELGEGGGPLGDVKELREKLAKLELPEEVRLKAAKELERLAQMPSASPEIGIVRTYLDWIIDLPWSKTTEDNFDLNAVEQVLNANHFGLPKVKERIIEHIAVRKLASDTMRTPILCFVGPPGTGKTSLGKSIAEALGRSFVRVSLGGIRDEAEIRGHRRTYIGAMPGRIIQTMRRAGTVNPIFMLDEIDKIGADYRGDPSAALLEVLDPEQNHAFSDHYLDVPYNLSRVLFITTANWLDPVPWALQDRLEVIRFSGYTESEKLKIARTFLVPKQLKEHGLKQLRITDLALRSLVREYTYESGVRNLDRELANICRKVARRVAEDKPPVSQVTPLTIGKYLGPPKFDYGVMEEQDEIGVAMGVAWTSGGGDTMPLEVIIMDGKGGMQLTGQVGEQLQESAQAALSYSRAHARELGITANFDRIDIHIHFPEMAVAKDGPSAGVTVATALISALTRRPVRRDVTMTGEMTLRGRVLPIGGVKEKTLAAHRAGLKTFILPYKNRKDLVDVPKNVQRDLSIVLVKTIADVLSVALVAEKPVTRPAANLRRGRSVRHQHSVPKAPEQPPASAPAAH
ncbi:MAG: endopeptidase La [Chloroflexi bacterium]|nr:endopeptidase La [Chloroflexota bacterium]